MLGPRTPQNVGAEKRTKPRCGRGHLVRVRRPMSPGAPPRLASVQNASTHGIGLLLSGPVSTDTVLEIEMLGGKRFARVVHSSKEADGWLVGCLLNNSLSDSEVEQLLN